MAENKGITLVALVITVIVMIILAVVTVGTLTNTDIFGQAEYAVSQTKQAEIAEIMDLAIQAATTKFYGIIPVPTDENEYAKYIKEEINKKHSGLASVNSGSSVVDVSGGDYYENKNTKITVSIENSMITITRDKSAGKLGVQ